MLDSTRHICRFIASSYVKFLCFITLSTLFLLYFESSSSSLSRWPGFYSLRPFLSSIYTTCPYNIDTLFYILSELICVTPFFLRRLYFLLLAVWRSLSAFLKIHMCTKHLFLYLESGAQISQPHFKFTQIQYKYCCMRNDVYRVIWSYTLLHFLCCPVNRICVHDLGNECKNLFHFQIIYLTAHTVVP
jgi:hypothetical protein